jgi:FkbH-like protein
MTDLVWLPDVSDWRAQLKNLPTDPELAWEKGVRLANAKLDFITTTMLDSALRQALGGNVPRAAGKPVRLALLGSCTMAQLHAAIRVAGLRRGIQIEIYENDYGQYWQELTDSSSALHAFKPTVVLFALDAHHLASAMQAHFDEASATAELQSIQQRISECWRLARTAFQCSIIQQTVLPVHLPLLGNNEHRLWGSRSHLVARLNQSLRTMADAQGVGVDLLAIDDRARQDGIKAWFDLSLWHRAKQEIKPSAAPMYGELLVRILAARLGKSFKCLVLDLDNTLWGGVIGDDGLEDLVLGQGSGEGEAYVAFQEYARALSRRGIILAVCSKNDESNALEPFDKHAEMLLKRSDIACFVANWQDKVANLKRIAEQLNIGIDSLVFVDDNPFERTLVRQELPMVAVPEISDDPTFTAELLSAAGYFEATSVTEEDLVRGAQYQGNLQREVLRASVTDLPAYLRSLEMQLKWRPFDQVGLSRTTQLINKTNQFNLTTQRYTEQEVLAITQNPRAFGLQLRLLDRFGDNGIIGVVIGKMQGDDELLIDTWLMSCRVLGRQVEPTTLNLVAEQARRLGARRLVGEYRPTKKNGMVKDHYAKLGFTVVSIEESGASRAILDLSGFVPVATFVDVQQG